MNTLIITGGNIESDFALHILKETFDIIIGVDGGIQFCYENDIIPSKIVGDFDTLSPEILKWYKENTEIEIQEFNPIKDATDTQIAVELALELGSETITILGGTGSRLDHVLGNIHTLYLALSKGVCCQMVDAHNRIRLIENNFSLLKAEQFGTYFSLLPFTTNVKKLTIRGAKYPLCEASFSILKSAGWGVSNEIVSKKLEIEMEEGVLIFIESKD